MAAEIDTLNAEPTPVSSLYLQDTDEVKRVFKRFDTNGDGKISITELTEIMRTLGTDTSPEEVNRMMEEIDTDRDGFINLEEFTEFCRAGSENSEGELKEAFELYDINKNGLISSSELHQILSRLGENCTESDCVKMIESVDSDGDGYVNFEEFKTMMSRPNQY